MLEPPLTSTAPSLAARSRGGTRQLCRAVRSRSYPQTGRDDNRFGHDRRRRGIHDIQCAARDVHSDDHYSSRGNMQHEFAAGHRSVESDGGGELRLHQLHRHSDQPVTQLPADKRDFVRDMHGNYNYACPGWRDVDRDVDRNGYRRRNNAERDAERDRNGCRSSADHVLGDVDDLYRGRKRDFRRCNQIRNGQRNCGYNSGDLPSITGD